MAPSSWSTALLSFHTGRPISSLNLHDLQHTHLGSHSSLRFWSLFIKSYLVFQPATTTPGFYKMQQNIAAQPLRHIGEESKERKKQTEKWCLQCLLTDQREETHSTMSRSTEKAAQCRKLAVFPLSSSMKASGQCGTHRIRNCLFECLAELEHRSRSPGSLPGKSPSGM